MYLKDSVTTGKQSNQDSTNDLKGIITDDLKGLVPDLKGHINLENKLENLRLQVSPRHEPKFKGSNVTLE